MTKTAAKLNDTTAACATLADLYGRQAAYWRKQANEPDTLASEYDLCMWLADEAQAKCDAAVAEATKASRAYMAA